MGGSAHAQEPVRIGIVKSIFGERSEKDVQAEAMLFKQIMEDQTKRQGESQAISDVWNVAEQLAAGKLQFGVCHGFELAWAKTKFPHLQPLVVAVNKQPYVQAVIVVKADDASPDVKALAGKTLARAKRWKAFCKLFLQSQIGDGPFFGKVLGADPFKDRNGLERDMTDEDALDAVVEGQAHAALLDSVALAWYQENKPGAFKRLKVLARSPEFPPTVIFFMGGKVDQATQDLYTQALLAIHQAPDYRGKNLLTAWRFSHFDRVPADYDKKLGESAKAFPPKE
jgi:ABC-type phosphate/phosphonate transport system substrate-binding protein